MKEKTSARQRLLRVRFSDSEWRVLESKASEANRSKSELVRQSINAVKVKNKSAEKDLAVVLNRINANLNMIAKWCNTYKSGADCLQVVAGLQCIEREVNRLVENKEG